MKNEEICPDDGKSTQIQEIRVSSLRIRSV